MSRTIYESEDWILLHLKSPQGEQHKAILCSNSYTNYITIDLNKAVNNIFYVLMDGKKAITSESPINDRYAFAAQIQINADDATLNLADQEQISFKRIQPDFFCS